MSDDTGAMTSEPFPRLTVTDGDGNPVTMTVTEGFGGAWKNDGTQAVWGSRDGDSWSMEFPGRGADPTWVQDPEQPYENWRTYHTRDGWYALTLRHDRCVDIDSAANVPFWIGDHKLTDEERDRINHDGDESIHLCDIGGYIDLIRSIVPLSEAWENRPR